MPKQVRLVLLVLVFSIALVGGGLMAYWRNRKTMVGDYLVSTQRSGSGVLLAEAVSWDDKRLRLDLVWDDKDKTELEWRVDFLKTFIIIPSNVDQEMPLVNRKAPEFKTAFCEGDKLEIKVTEWALEKKLREIGGEDIEMIRNLGPRECR